MWYFDAATAVFVGLGVLLLWKLIKIFSDLPPTVGYGPGTHIRARFFNGSANPAGLKIEGVTYAKPPVTHTLAYWTGVPTTGYRYTSFNPTNLHLKELKLYNAAGDLIHTFDDATGGGWAEIVVGIYDAAPGQKYFAVASRGFQTYPDVAEQWHQA